MSVTHGMDVGEVRRLGGSLQSKADQLDALIKDVDRGVGGSSWVGPDAVMFKTQWWPERKAQLLRASQDLHGLGQSALNNAEEQDRASDVSPAGGSEPPGSAPSSGGSTDSAAGGAGGSESGVLSGHRSDAEVIAAYRENPPAGYEPGTGLEWQCTAWAQYRWRELGYDGPMGHGNGWAVAGNNGGSVDTPPSLGALASYGTEANLGHVMVVEEIGETAGGLPRIRVSEMNAEGLGSNDGIEALPEEYRDDRWFVQQSDGSWSREGGSGVGEIRFATFPGST